MINHFFFFFSFILLLFVGCFSSNKGQQAVENTSVKTSKESGMVEILRERKMPSTPLVGYNLVPAFQPSWDKASFQNAVKDLAPMVLRFPGGNESQYFDWKEGALDRGLRARKEVQRSKVEKMVYKQPPMLSAKLKDLKQGIQLTQSIPVFCLNVNTTSLDNQLDMLRTARRMGIPVQYIELGNEIYVESEDYEAKYPTPKAYAEAMQSWTERIRSEFPEAKIAAVGYYTAYKAKSKRRQDWNEAIFKYLPDVDAITIHPYITHNAHSNGVTNPISAFKHMNQKIGGLKDFLDTVPQQYNLWVTEFNFSELKTDHIRTTWLHGLLVSKMLLGMLENTRLTMLVFHGISGWIPYAALNTRDNPNQNSKTAAGAAMSQFFTAIKKTNTLSILDFKMPTNLPGGLPLEGIKVQNNREDILVIMNPNKMDYQLKLNTNSTEIATEYTHIPPNQLLKKKILEKDLTSNKARPKKVLHIPSYSISTITLKH